MAGLSLQTIGGVTPIPSNRYLNDSTDRAGVFSQRSNGRTALGPAAVADFSPESLARSRDFSGGEKETTPGELTDEEQQEVDQLKQRDREVRQHEQAHVAAGGQYVTSGPSYQFTNGPDGRRYATGGEVNISVSPERTPEETLRKARIVRAAALAPAEPSAQDRRVAAQASQLESSARREIAEQRGEEQGTGPTSAPDSRQGISLSA